VLTIITSLITLLALLKERLKIKRHLTLILAYKLFAILNFK
jgi:hypothetical protein